MINELENRKLDRTSPVPLHHQLKLLLLREIQTGHFARGKPIPSEKVLQKEYQVSLITMRRALGDLAREGYLIREQGRGTMVTGASVEDRSDRLGGFYEDLLAQGFEVSAKILELQTCPAPQAVAEKLAVDMGIPLLYFVRLVTSETSPIAVAMVYANLPNHVVLSREELEQGSIYPLLEKKYGIEIRRAQKTIQASLARPAEADLLQLKLPASILLVEWIGEQNRIPLIYVKALYRGDRYKYSLTVTR